MTWWNLCVAYSFNPRVMVTDQESKHLGRFGRVTEVSTSEEITVVFSTGPGDTSATFKYTQLSPMGEHHIRIKKEG